MGQQNSWPPSTGQSLDVHMITSLTRLEENQHRILRGQERHSAAIIQYIGTIKATSPPEAPKARRFPEWFSQPVAWFLLVALVSLIGHAYGPEKISAVLGGVAQILTALRSS